MYAPGRDTWFSCRLSLLPPARWHIDYFWSEEPPLTQRAPPGGLRRRAGRLPPLPREHAPWHRAGRPRAAPRTPPRHRTPRRAATVSPVAALRRPGREFSPGVWRTHHPGTTRPDVDNGYHFYIWWDTFRRPDRPRGSPPVPAPSPTAPPRSPTRSPTR